MIVFLPNCLFLSEVSRAIEIARALEDRGASVAFASRGGAYAYLITEAGFDFHPLEPASDDAVDARFLAALLDMGPGGSDFYTDDELALAVAEEAAFFERMEASLVVTGFTLSAYLSTRLVGVPLATDHGGSFVPPVLAHSFCPAPVNAPAALLHLPRSVQRWLSNRVPALIKNPTRQINRHAARLGVESVPGLMGLMCGELTMVTELPQVFGVSAEELEDWQPRWPFRLRSGTTFAFTGPLYARLDIPAPAEVEAFLDDEGPVVYLAPTTVEEPFLRALVAQAKTAGARLLVGATVHDISDLADPWTLVSGVLPNHLIMPRVAAAVIMGGQGSVQTAMASGTPFIGLPYHPEQELNIAVAERMGMALRMAPREAETSKLGVAIRRLLEDASFASSAAVVKQHYQGVDGAGMAAEAILSFLSNRKSSDRRE